MRVGMWRRATTPLCTSSLRLACCVLCSQHEAGRTAGQSAGALQMRRVVIRLALGRVGAALERWHSAAHTVGRCSPPHLPRTFPRTGRSRLSTPRVPPSRLAACRSLTPLDASPLRSRRPPSLLPGWLSQIGSLPFGSAHHWSGLPMPHCSPASPQNNESVTRRAPPMPARAALSEAVPMRPPPRSPSSRAPLRTAARHAHSSRRERTASVATRTSSSRNRANGRASGLRARSSDGNASRPTRGNVARSSNGRSSSSSSRRSVVSTSWKVVQQSLGSDMRAVKMVTSTVHWSGRGRNVAQMKPIRTQTRCGRDFARLSTDNSSSDIFYDVRGPQAAKSLHGWVLYAQSTRPRRARLLALVRRIVQVHLIRTIKRWKSVARDLHEAHQRQSRNEQVRNEKFPLTFTKCASRRIAQSYPTAATRNNQTTNPRPRLGD